MPRDAASAYQPLTTSTSTRVLTLLPGPDNSAINIELHEVHLEHSPNYEAVSYTWGSEGNEQTVYVNDEPVDIRYNLYCFMFRLRQQKRKPRMLWVDAISISQIDLEEKRKQVAIIGKIFSLAKRVLIWLGEHSHGSEILFRRLWDSSHIRPYYNDSRHGTSSGTRMQAHALRWAELLSRPYFQRLWVVQEIALAKTIRVHCGNDWQDWDSLIGRRIEDRVDTADFDGISSIEYGDERFQKLNMLFAAPHLNDLLDHVWALNNARKAKNAGLLETLMEWLKYDLKCSDRRDNVYALLSLCIQQASIPPDYQIGIPKLFPSSV